MPRPKLRFVALPIVLIGCAVPLVALLLCCGAGMYFGWRSAEDAKKELAEANRLWDAGEKAEAVRRYESVLARNAEAVPNDTEKSVVYLRAVEFEIEQGNTESAKQLIDKALQRNVELRASNRATMDLITQVRSDRDKREAEERAAREAEERLRQEQRDQDAKRREVERQNAPRLTAHIEKLRIEPFRGATGLDTSMVYVDWKNTGNRPVRGLTASIRVTDGRGRVLYSVPDYFIYATLNDRPGVAPGETYIEPNGEGHVLPTFPQMPDRIEAEVKIVRVLEAVPE